MIGYRCVVALMAVAWVLPAGQVQAAVFAKPEEGGFSGNDPLADQMPGGIRPSGGLFPSDQGLGFEGNPVSDEGLSVPTGFSAGPKRGDLLLETDLIRLDDPAAADNSPPLPDPAAPTGAGEYVDRKGLVRMISKHWPLIVCGLLVPVLIAAGWWLGRRSAA